MTFICCIKQNWNFPRRSIFMILQFFFSAFTVSVLNKIRKLLLYTQMFLVVFKVRKRKGKSNLTPRPLAPLRLLKFWVVFSITSPPPSFRPKTTISSVATISSWNCSQLVLLWFISKPSGLVQWKKLLKTKN